MNDLTLIANPGSASRKYALYRGEQQLAYLHFEYRDGRVSCSARFGGEQLSVPVELFDLDGALAEVLPLLKKHGVLESPEAVARIGLSIVAPSSYFLRDRIMGTEETEHLRALEARTPFHIRATLHELDVLRETFPTASISGISDSAFHASKPDYAWNYGVRLQDADRFEIKRFGYHGISAASVVHILRESGKLPPRVIIVHLGSGASVTAVHGGKSLDTTMGYSPLEGLIMANRVGSIDPTAANLLQSQLQLNDEQMEDYLNSHSGLLGLSELSSAVDKLLEHEARGNHQAGLALQTYIFAVQKAVGSMSAAMAGADMLVFTGTVGERSAPIRQRVTERLHFMDFIVDDKANDTCTAPSQLTRISRLAHSKPIYVMPTDEANEMVRRVNTLHTP